MGRLSSGLGEREKGGTWVLVGVDWGSGAGLWIEANLEVCGLGSSDCGEWGPLPYGLGSGQNRTAGGHPGTAWPPLRPGAAGCLAGSGGSALGGIRAALEALKFCGIFIGDDSRLGVDAGFERVNLSALNQKRPCPQRSTRRWTFLHSGDWPRFV